jgi:hypothetical protein
VRCEKALAGTSVSWLWPRISESRLRRPADEVRRVSPAHHYISSGLIGSIETEITHIDTKSVLYPPEVLLHEFFFFF